MPYSRLCWLILIFLVPVQAIAAGNIMLSQCESTCRLPSPLEIYEDTEGSTNVEDIPKGVNFRTVTNNKPNFGPSNSFFWLRFSIQNDTNKDKLLWLELDPYVIDAILYSFTSPATSAPQQKQFAGSRYALEEREVKHVKPLMRLSISANQTTYYYLRLQSIVAVMDFKFWNVEKFAETESTNQYMFGMWYGLMIVMVIYNLFLFLSIRDNSYLCYCIYLTGVIFNQMGISGHAIYLAPEGKAALFTETFGIFYAFWAIQFVKSFFDTQTLPKINHLLSVLAITLLIPFYFLLTGDHKLCILTMNLTGIIIIFSVSAVGLLRLKQGFKPARFFVLAWSFSLLGILIYITRGLGFIPSNIITENSARIGSAIEVVLLSLALADRINQLKIERQQEVQLKLNAFDKIHQMNTAFEKFVPHQFIELLQKNEITDLKPGVHTQRVMSVLFSDIRGFTQLSESMTPTENFKFINSYLKRMEPHIQKHNGFIDKFIGDAIMALFDESADDAVNAGIEMIHSLIFYNQFRAKSGYIPLNIGVGVNTGSLILGTVGDDTRMDSTVISDAVNLASRIEQLCKTYEVSLLISQETYLALKRPEQFHCRLIDKVKTKGKRNETIIYEVINADTPESASCKIHSIEQFNDAVFAYQAGDFTVALALFQDIKKANPNDNPARIYVEQTRLRLQGL